MLDKKSLAHLTPDVLNAVRRAVDTAQNDQDIQYIKDWIERPDVYRYPLVSVDTFMDSKFYLGIGNNIYPNVRRMANEILDGGYTEAAVVIGIGGGKSMLAEILSTYLVFKLLCLKNPFDYYGLAADKQIAIMNMGPSATQAKEVVFAGIRSFIEKTPFFQRFEPIILSESITFKKEMILMVPGNSKATKPLGYNVFGAVLDEAAFYMDTDERDVAEEIYNGLQRRIVSRFGSAGLLIMISSPRYVGDFLMKKYALSQKAEFKDHIYGLKMPTWKSRPYNQDTIDNSFLFSTETKSILDYSMTYDDDIDFLENDFDEKKKIWQIPKEYKKSFKQNPEKAMRDLGATPSTTLQGFITRKDYVEAMFDEREAPYDKHTNELVMGTPERTAYFGHFDLALNRKGKGDAAAFCLARFDGYDVDEDTKEKKKKVYIEYLLRLTAGDQGEIDFSALRKMVYRIKDAGYYLKLITFDGFQCFRWNTKIPTIGKNGNEEKFIKDVVVGDYVYSVDSEGLPVIGEVSAVGETLEKEVWEVVLSNDKKLECSGDHPFMLDDNTFVEARSLKKGAFLKTVGCSELLRVKAVKSLEIKEVLWDITIKEHHTFSVSAGVYVHNSSDFMQILRKKGIKTDELSVDRTMEPYNILKNAIYEKRIKCHSMPMVQKELLGLEVVKGRKIDHNKDSSKDCSDALAGAVYNVLQQSGGMFSMGMEQGFYFNDLRDKIQTPFGQRPSVNASKDERIEYYKSLEKLNSSGLL